jgi:hypothetical protein
VSEAAPEVHDRLARALCLTGARSREDLLAMRKRVAERVDDKGLLGAMSERGEAALAAVDDLEGAIEDRRVGYVSVVASA